MEYLFQQGEISKGVFRRGSHLKIMDMNGVMSLEADLTDHHTLHEAVEGCDTVYSMASPMPFGDSGFEKTNTEGLLNLLEAAQEAKVKTIVHLSTLDVYGFHAGRIEEATLPAPADGYQRSKLESERLVLEFGKRNPSTNAVVIRAARAVGSRDPTLAGPLLGMMEKGAVVLPESKTMSFTHPKDIAQAMYRAATATAMNGRTFLTKSFDATSEELARQLVSSAGGTASVRRQGLFARSSLPSYTQDQLKASLRFEDQPGWKELGYTPSFGLKETCDEIAQWYKKEPWGSTTR